MAFDAWKQESSTLDGCGWCRERFRIGDVVVYVEDSQGHELLRLHDCCLSRVRAAIPSQRTAKDAASIARPEQAAETDEA